MKQTSNIDPSLSSQEEDYEVKGSVSSSSDGASISTGDHDVDAAIVIAVTSEANFDDEAQSDMKGDDELQEQSEMSGTYPADCYSFLAIHGPTENPTFFSFGILVWLFQVRTDRLIFILYWVLFRTRW